MLLILENCIGRDSIGRSEQKRYIKAKRLVEELGLNLNQSAAILIHWIEGFETVLSDRRKFNSVVNEAYEAKSRILV